MIKELLEGQDIRKVVLKEESDISGKNIMDKKITITYRWWDESEDVKEDPSGDMLSLLEDAAEDRIAEMVKEGYTSGELNYQTDEVLYTGWWEKTTQTL